MKFQRCLLFLWIIEEVIYEIIKLYKNLKEEIIMGNLFGYKKWYKVDKTIEKDGETYTIKKEVGIKRKYLDKKMMKIKLLMKSLLINLLNTKQIMIYLKNLK